MSKRKTHYPMPMSMGQSICRVGKAVMHSGDGFRVHASTVDLVGTIEETTCVPCRRAFFGTADGEPNPECTCVDDYANTECPVHVFKPIDMGAQP